MYFPPNPIYVENIVNSEVDVEDLIEKFILTKTYGVFGNFKNQQDISDGQVFLPTTFVTPVNLPPNQFLGAPLVSMQPNFSRTNLNVLPPNNHIIDAYPQIYTMATPIIATPQAPSPNSQSLTPSRTNESFQLPIRSDQFQTQYYTSPGQFPINFQPEISWVAMPKSPIAQVDQPNYYCYLPSIENCNILLTNNQNRQTNNQEVLFSNVSENTTNQQVLAGQIMPTSTNTPENVSFVQQIAIQHDLPDPQFVPNQMTELNRNNESVTMERCMARKQGIVNPYKESASTLSKCLISNPRETTAQPTKLKSMATKQTHTNPYETIHPQHKNNTNLKIEERSKRTEARVNLQKHTNSRITIQSKPKVNTNLTSEKHLVRSKASKSTNVPLVQENINLKREETLMQPMSLKYEVDQQKLTNPYVTIQPVHKINTSLKTDAKLVQPVPLRSKVDQQEFKKSYVIVQPLLENNTNLKTREKLKQTMEFKSEVNLQKQIHPSVIVKVPHENNVNLKSEKELMQQKLLKHDIQQKELTKSSVIVQPPRENKTNPMTEVKLERPLALKYDINQKKHSNSGVIEQPRCDNKTSMKAEAKAKQRFPLKSRVNQQKCTNPSVIVQLLRENNTCQTIEKRPLHPLSQICETHQQKHTNPSVIVRSLRKNSSSFKAEERLAHPIELLSEVNHQKRKNSNVIRHLGLISEEKQQNYTNFNEIVRPLHENSSNSKAEEKFVFPTALISEVNHQKRRDTNAIAQPIHVNSINPKADGSFNERNTNQNTEGRLLHSIPLKFNAVEQKIANSSKSIPPKINNKTFENMVEPAESIATTSITNYQTALIYQHSVIEPLDKCYSLSSCYLETIEQRKRAQEMECKSQINQQQNSTFLARKYVLSRNRFDESKLERNPSSYTNHAIELDQEISQTHEQVEAGIRNMRVQEAYEVISRLIKAVEKRPILYQNDPKEYYVDLNIIRTWIEVAQEILGTRDGTQICSCINMWRVIYDDYKFSLQMGVLHELDGMLHFLKSSNVGNVDNCDNFHIAEKCDNAQREHDSDRGNDFCLKESDQRFLISLLPDLRHMNEKQMEFFEKSVVELISEISV